MNNIWCVNIIAKYMDIPTLKASLPAKDINRNDQKIEKDRIMRSCLFVVHARRFELPRG